MKINKPVKPEPIFTHGGAPASRVNNEAMLRRSVMSCMLWENEFYEDGVTISKRIAELIPKVPADRVAAIAIEARNNMKLRHMPLYIVREMARYNTHSKYVASTLAEIIQRPDELSEYLAIYWKDKKCPISAQSKKGLAAAFTKFDEYQLAKYNRDAAIKLRDVLFLCHAKPKDAAQDKLWKRLINDELAVPETWEVLVSAAGSNVSKKREAFESLLSKNKMGALAVLRNLRNFEANSVDEKLIIKALTSMKADRVLPFRFIEASKYAPRFEQYVESAMLKCMEGFEQLGGKTVIIIDRSGSMRSSISSKSNMTRQDAADALAILARGIFSDLRVYATAGNDPRRQHATTIVPARQGFALRDAMRATRSQIGGGGIFLKQVMDYVKEHEKSADRIIVITDEQDCDNINPAHADAFGKKNYLINVANNRNGIAYSKFLHIDGFSESCLNYIVQYERALASNLI